MSISSVDSAPLHIKPEVDLNLATEANRIVYVLNKIVARAQLTGLLTEFMKNDGLLLQNILDSTTHFKVMKTCEKYSYSVLSRTQSISDYQSYQGEKDFKRESSEIQSDNDEVVDDGYDDEEEDHTDNDNYMDQSSHSSSSSEKLLPGKRKVDDLANAIYILEENPEVQKLVQSMQKKLSPEMKFFLKILIEFKNRMEMRLREDATQCKIREQYMRETYEKNEKAKKEIDRLEEELLVTKTDANVCLIGRNILIKRHQRKIERIQQSSQEAIEKRVKESEKQMVNNWKTSSAKQDDLRQELDQTSEKYSNLLKDHLAAERVLRARRAKVENQVLGWIQKFDQDIGEKQAEEEQIQAILDQETKELQEIQRKLDEQEEEYDELMQEKAEYEEEMLERRMYQFIVNRSARRIQRSYRLYKARKLAKKLARKEKKGKGKGKKKE